MISRYSFFGGRRVADRRGPGDAQFVDRYESSLFLFLAAIALFNLFDCFFTLVQMERGATELNPFARFLLEQGPGLFIFTKSLGIGLILCFLCLHKNFRLARVTMAFAFYMYFGIFLYHLEIYLFQPPSYWLTGLFLLGLTLYLLGKLGAFLFRLFRRTGPAAE